ncbi:uncharacterized protein [Gossypium hirsutum]|uniref:Tf2-1-like SH3-like domain-containing protein n=1 Tax=Gossypium hirsutum TaxID=3635 RepID=A0A1U8P8A9_GOSHI|nr:uncharacterized protein LOC107956148 [Gossypium hirsutum]
MTSFETLYGRKYRTPLYWSKLSELKLVGTDLIQETKDKVQIIHNCLKAAFDHQKSYADLKWRDIEFTIGDGVFLKVSPLRKVLRFGKKRKLSPRFIRPYEITERVGPVAYKLVLPSELEKINNVFHVSMLRQYRSNPSHVVTPSEIEILSDLSYFEGLSRVLVREVKEQQNKKVPLVKVLWNRHKVEEAIWETEYSMRSQYPHLFTSKKFGDKIS